MNYDEYYRLKLEQGQLYEDFVRKQLTIVGMPINIYSSQRYQIQEGESPNGAEVKFDDKMARTARLWIEIAEKATQRDGPYARSGVYRPNIAFYIQGDYDLFYIFPINALRCEVESGNYEKRENDTKTSVGILLPMMLAERISQRVQIINGNPKVVQMSKRLRDEARDALRNGDSRLPLFGPAGDPKITTKET